MARLSQLSTAASLVDGDLLYVVDVSETLPDDRSKKVTLGALAAYIGGGGGGGTVEDLASGMFGADVPDTGPFSFPSVLNTGVPLNVDTDLLNGSLRSLGAGHILGDDESSTLRLARFNGTPQTPTQVLENDEIGSIVFQAFTGTALVDVARIRTVAATDIESLSRAAFMQIDLPATDTGDIVDASLLFVAQALSGTELVSINTARDVLFIGTGVVEGWIGGVAGGAVVRWGVTGTTLAFFGTTPIAQPELPTVPSLTDVVEALKDLGLVTQAV